MQPSFHFLYRESEGAIGPALWARASALPVGVASIMTLIAWAIAPRAPRDLGSQPFFSFTILAVHTYLMIYGFALILLAVAQYFVSSILAGPRPGPGLRRCVCCSRALRTGFSRVRKERCPFGRFIRSMRWRSRLFSGTLPS